MGHGHPVQYTITYIHLYLPEFPFFLSSSRRETSQTSKSSDFNQSISTNDKELNRSTSNKSFSSKEENTCAQIHEINNFTTSTSSSSRMQNMGNNLKCSTALSIRPPVASPFVNNTFANIKRPCYEQSYNSFWSENPTALQTPSHSYGLPYYLLNAPSTCSSSTSGNNECAKSSIYKNTTSKADTMSIYQPNLAQIFWDMKTDSTKKYPTTNEYSNHSKHHVNWMTTDSNNHSKVNNSNHPDSVGNFVNAYHHPSQATAAADEILVSASTRLLDSSNFLSEPTLPNLNGDLALGTISSSVSCIHSTNSSARHSNIQDDTMAYNNNYQRVNNFSAESLFSSTVSNNTGPDTKRQKNSNEYFSSAPEVNANVGCLSNTMPTTSFFHPSFENLNYFSTNGSTSMSQMPSNDLHYTQNVKNCSKQLNSGITNPQSANDSYKNIHSLPSKSQSPFTALDSCQNNKTDLAEHEQAPAAENRTFDSAYANSADFNKLSKNMLREETDTNTLGHFDNSFSNRSTYGINGQLQPHNKIIYSNNPSKSKSQMSFYNHSSSAPVNINLESTNSTSNAITNFNLSTICPEIDRDFLIK